MTSLAQPPANPGWHETEPWIRFGNRIAVVVVGGLFIASMVLSISGAVVANGAVTVEGNYKSIQHLDGGLVADIAVKNGDRVQRGAVLVRLDDTQARASLAIVMARLGDQLVQQARLAAERDRHDTFELPATMSALADDPQVRENLAAQMALFQARTASHRGEQAVLRQRLEQLQADLSGHQRSLLSSQRQLDLANKDLATVEPLYRKGFASQQRYGGLQREQARMEGDVGRLDAEIQRTRGAIAEAELRLLQSEKDYTQAIVDEMRKVQAQVAELEENRKTFADKLARIVIRAPESGRVHALAVFTQGGVVPPGKEIMQIVPDGARLVVDAQVPPQEIDKVRAGGQAWVRFPAFNARTTPRLSGTVASVSAAELTNGQGRTYFTARIEISAEDMKQLSASQRLLPGMPAEVYIGLEDRSILSYLLKPLADAMMHAFRES